MSSDVSPQWNARVSDRVWLKVKGKWQTDWRVVKVGFSNEHGYRMNIKISNNKQSIIRSPFSYPHDIFIIPPSDELPQEVREYADKHKLRVCRYCGNCETPNYRFFCPRCKEEVFARIKSVETSNFGAQAYKGKLRFYEGRSEVDECHTDYVCKCKGKRYDEPEEVEKHW